MADFYYSRINVRGFLVPTLVIKPNPLCPSHANDVMNVRIRRSVPHAIFRSLDHSVVSSLLAHGGSFAVTTIERRPQFIIRTVHHNVLREAGCLAYHLGASDASKIPHPCGQDCISLIWRVVESARGCLGLVCEVGGHIRLVM